MMVMMASSGPRVWSAFVMGGKMDGVSGPGVGSVSRVVQAGWVGTMIFVGKTKSMEGVGVLGVEQADSMESRSEKEIKIEVLDVRMIFIFESPLEVVRRKSSN